MSDENNKFALFEMCSKEVKVIDDRTILADVLGKFERYVLLHTFVHNCVWNALCVVVTCSVYLICGVENISNGNIRVRVLVLVIDRVSLTPPRTGTTKRI